MFFLTWHLSREIFSKRHAQCVARRHNRARTVCVSAGDTSAIFALSDASVPVNAGALFLRFRLCARRLPLSLSARDDGVGEKDEVGRSPSIIISHAVVRECIPERGLTNVDSMLFPLITFIIGFKVSRPLVKSVPNVSLARRTYDSSGTPDARTRVRREPYINFIEPRADHFELRRSAPRLVFHYCSPSRKRNDDYSRRCTKKQPG